jgi:hypothetical protein
MDAIAERPAVIPSLLAMCLRTALSETQELGTRMSFVHGGPVLDSIS